MYLLNLAVLYLHNRAARVTLVTRVTCATSVTRATEQKRATVGYKMHEPAPRSFTTTLILYFRWLDVRMNSMSGLLVFISALFCVVSTQISFLRHLITPSIAALVLTLTFKVFPL